MNYYAIIIENETKSIKSKPCFFLDKSRGYHYIMVVAKCLDYFYTLVLRPSYGFALEESLERERGAELCRLALSKEKRLPFATHGLGE